MCNPVEARQDNFENGARQIQALVKGQSSDRERIGPGSLEKLEEGVLEVGGGAAAEINGSEMRHVEHQLLDNPG